MNHPDHTVDLRVSDNKRRDKPEVPVCCTIDQYTISCTLLLDFRTSVAQGDANHQAADPGIIFFQAFPEPFSFPAYVGQNLLDYPDSCKCGCTCQRPPGQCAPAFAL